MNQPRIADDAIVIRGGRNRSEDVARGIARHPSGVIGVSVYAASGVSLDTLAIGIPHSRIGVTSVGEVRTAGGDVIRTSGRSLYHATVMGLDPDTISSLLTPTQANPARGKPA